MPYCSQCAAPLQDGSRFCAACGKPQHGAPSTAAATSTHVGAIPLHSSSFPDPSGGGRFIPGTVLQGRYRIIGLLGRGGMGEVYRADDLKLGQAVALKWLPLDVETDSARLARFLGEVRHSLKVTHPNVCRVFDVGEVDGQHFLSMEYVDGENLASLLRRIGRLPEDKAVQVARQLCAGLAAAHNEGVLHRDMKPANVMIDGRGRAKITDFGLAGTTEGIAGAEARAGTPGYMAPEQIAGRELTRRTDIYALGLVLYELFTGKRAYEANSLAEMARMQETSPTTLSSHVQNLDPTVESIILRCLAPEPENRPASAEAVAMALPGGDPLAAAIAAGETPSPDMVAATGGRGGLSTRVAWILLALSLSLVGLGVVLQSKRFLIDYLEPEKSAPVLADDARDLLRELGLYDPELNRSSGFLPTPQATEWMRDRAKKQERRDWFTDAGSELPWLRFWYRQRTERLTSPAGYGYSSHDDPPFLEPGEVRVILDQRARLLALDVVPNPEHLGSAEPASFDWTPLLAATGFKAGCLSPAESKRIPTFYADTRVAWEGECEGWPHGKLRIEAASLAGKPVSFRVDEYWTRPFEETDGGEDDAKSDPSGVIAGFVYLALLIGAVLLARRNLRIGRCDLRGANLILAVYILVHTISIMPLLPLTLADFTQQFHQMIGAAGFQGAVLWVSYLALEPIVRRRWPTMLVSWSRLLQGGVVDPLVGRDVLIGVVGSSVALAVMAGVGWGQLAFNVGEQPGGINPAWMTLDSAVAPTLWFLHLPLHALEGAMTAMLVFVFLTIVLRKTPAAIAVFLLIPLGMSIAFAESWILTVIPIVLASVFLTLILRVGFLSAAIAVALGGLMESLVYSTDLGSWYGLGSLVTLVGFALVAFCGFWVALAGRPMFGTVE